MKLLSAVTFLAVVASATAAMSDSEACTKFCSAEWPEADLAKQCDDVCQSAASNSLNDCQVSATDSKDMQNAYNGGCNYGRALGRSDTCDTHCDQVEITHHLSKFFDLACRYTCNKLVDLKKSTEGLSCRNQICNSWRGVNACWTACSYAFGLIDGTERSATAGN
jgi:hypothetical protein